MHVPLLTVLMPVYNSEAYIIKSLDSILCQTLSDFELIIIDDASTDESVSVIRGYHDSRIILFVKEKNTGYTNSLNMGLSQAKGRYIARMDSDDICNPNRFQIQYDFMESNPEVAVCGSWFQIIGQEQIIRHPQDHEEIKVALLHYSAISHPTAFMRTSFLKEHQLSYDAALEPSEDYDLWCRISKRGRIANIPEVLLHYRIHDKQVSMARQHMQSKSAYKIRDNYLMQLVPEKANSQSFYSIYHAPDKNAPLINQVLSRFELLEELRTKNKRSQFFRADLFERFILEEKKRLMNFFFKNNQARNVRNGKLFLLRGLFLVKYSTIKRALGYLFDSFIMSKP